VRARRRNKALRQALFWSGPCARWVHSGASMSSIDTKVGSPPHGQPATSSSSKVSFVDLIRRAPFNTQPLLLGVGLGPAGSFMNPKVTLILKSNFDLAGLEAPWGFCLKLGAALEGSGVAAKRIMPFSANARMSGPARSSRAGMNTSVQACRSDKVDLVPARRVHALFTSAVLSIRYLQMPLQPQ